MPFSGENGDILTGSEVQYHRLLALEKTGLVQAVISHRQGGISQGPFHSLNLGLRVGDEEELVLENRRRLLQALGLDLDAVVTAEQVHGDRIVRVGQKERGRGARSRETAIEGADGLITDEPGVVLLAFFADCVPIFLLDPERPAIGLAHAGWKGTVLGVAKKALAAMQREFGTDPRRCLAALGPSIGPCCYEVDEKVLRPLAEVYPYWRELVTLPEEPASARFHRGIPPVAEGARRGHLDLWRANLRQLEEAGLRPENIAVEGICTSCQHEVYFSYRADHGRTGRFGAIFTLKEGQRR